MNMKVSVQLVLNIASDQISAWYYSRLHGPNQYLLKLKQYSTPFSVILYHITFALVLSLCSFSLSEWRGY